MLTSSSYLISSLSLVMNIGVHACWQPHDGSRWIWQVRISVEISRCVSGWEWDDSVELKSKERDVHIIFLEWKEGWGCYWKRAMWVCCLGLRNVEQQQEKELEEEGSIRDTYWLILISSPPAFLSFLTLPYLTLPYLTPFHLTLPSLVLPFI